MRAAPGWTIWPGSTLRVRTLASVGASTAACASRCCAAAVAARDCASCACAWATSVPLSSLARVWACAPVTWARATSTARRVSSSRASLRKPCLTSCWVRASSASAARRVAWACSKAALVAVRPVLRRPASRACACRSAARAWATAASSSPVSSCTSRSPRRTWAPSSTGTRATRPVRVAPTFTRDSVLTRAENCSVRTSGAGCTMKASTSGARSFTVASTAAAAATAAPAPHHQRRFNMKTPCWSWLPLLL